MIRPTTRPPFHLRLHIALGHTLHARILVSLEPRAACLQVQQLAMARRQVRPLAGEQHAYDSITFLSQHKAHRVSMAIGGKTVAILSIAEVAARLQFFFPRASILVTGRSTDTRPSRA